MAQNEYSELLEEQGNAPPSTNPYTALLGEIAKGNEATLKRSTREAITKSPDAVAQSRQIADRLKVPIEMVERNPDLFKQQDAVESLPYDELIRTSPKLAGWLTNPTNAAVSSDDLAQMTAFDRAIQVGSNLLRAAPSGVYGGITSTPWGWIQAAADAAGMTGVADYAARVGAASLETAGQIRGPQTDAGFVEKAIYSGVESVGRSAIGLAAGVATGNPAVALGIIGATTAGPAYAQARTAGASPRNAAAFAVNEGAIEILTEALPASIFLRDLAKQAGFFKTVIKQIATEVPGEQAATLLQDLNEWAILTPNAPFSQYLAERPSAAAATLISTLVAAGTQTSVAVGTQRLFERLGETAAESKTLQRDPKSVEDFVAQAAKDTGVEQVYAPVETWITYWQSKGIDPVQAAADVTGDPNALQHAVATGADLVIPYSRYVVTLAATEHNAFFANEIRLDPAQMNARESEEFVKAQAKTQDISPQSQATPIRDTVQQQLEAAGVEPGVAATNAAIYEAAFATLAQRAGLDPVQLFGRYQLEIEREGVTTAVRPELRSALAGEGDGQTVFAQPLKDSGATDAELLADLFVGEAASAEGDRLLRIPSFAGMVAKVRGAALVDPKIFGAIVRSVPVEMVNDLFGSERAAENALRNVPVFKDSATFDADLSIAESIDAASPVGLLLSEAARQAAELPPVSPRAGRKSAESPLTPAARKGSAFSQGERAAITFGPDRKATITLFQNADLTSISHEGGHIFLEILRDLAPQSPDIAADLTILTDWFGTTEIGRDQHEQFARGFEAYLLEGKAPSPELRTVFARFSAWLKNIYKSMAGLNVQLTPEVRGVFDRLLASDDAIAAAEAEGRVAPLFTDAASAGVTEQVFASYQATVQAASEQAREQLQQRFMREVTREQTKQWRAERKKVRAQVQAEIYEAPVYRARAAILRGTNPDGTPLVDGQKPEPMKGVPLDTVAELFGFSSGDELSTALKAAPPMPRAIKAETDRRMKEMHGDLMTDPATVADAANAAVYGEGRAKVIEDELKALHAGMARGVIPKASVTKQAAEDQVRTMRVRDLKPGLYLVAAQRASKKAFDSFAANDRATAINAKQQELWSLAMYRAARDAQERAEASYKWVQRHDTATARARTGKAGQSYIDQWDGFLDRYEFKRVAQNVLDRRSRLRDWQESQQAEGLPMDLPAIVMDDSRRVNYRELTVEGLTGVIDGMKQLIHFARFKDDLQVANEKRKLAEATGAVATQVRSTDKPGRTTRLTRSQGMLEKVQKFGADLGASFLNTDTILWELDGQKFLGTVYTYLKGDVDRSLIEVLKPRLDAEAKAVEAINSVYQRGELQKREHIDSLDDSLSKEEIIAVALNVGSAGNRAALLESTIFAKLKLTEAGLADILSHLDKRDWDYVQAVWNHINTFWPEIAESQRRRKGVVPKKVDAVPVVTRFGTYAGGYYPLKYDKAKSILPSLDDVSEIVKGMRVGRFSAAATRDGFAKERVGSGGRPVLLSLSVIGQHINEVLYDLSVGDAIRNADRILRSSDVREAFDETGNAAAYQAMQLWVHDVAAGELAASDTLSRGLRFLRTGASGSVLLWNMSTVAVQPLGGLQTLALLKKRDAIGGLIDLMIKPKFGERSIFKQVMDASALMRDRRSSQNPDVMQVLQRVRESRVIPEWLRKSGYYAMTQAQWLVDMATWLGAHRQGLRESNGDTEHARKFADRMVIRAQATGLFAERSAFERGTMGPRVRQAEWVKMWTWLGSYMFAKGNIAYQKTRSTDFKNPVKVAGYITDMMLLFTFEAMLMDLIRGAWDEDDESLAWWMLSSTGKTMMSSIPFIRDVGSEVEGFRGGGPLESVAMKLGAAWTQVLQLELDEQLAKSISNVTGIFIHGYPSAAINRFIETNSRAEEGDDVQLIDWYITRPREATQ